MHKFTKQSLKIYKKSPDKFDAKILIPVTTVISLHPITKNIFNNNPILFRAVPSNIKNNMTFSTSIIIGALLSELTIFVKYSPV